MKSNRVKPGVTSFGIEPYARSIVSCVFVIQLSFCWCPKRDSNSHAEALASKTSVSTNSTIGAYYYLYLPFRSNTVYYSHSTQCVLSRTDTLLVSWAPIRTRLGVYIAPRAVLLLNGTPYGNRTHLYAVKGRCPQPIDERCKVYLFNCQRAFVS